MKHSFFSLFGLQLILYFPPNKFLATTWPIVTGASILSEWVNFPIFFKYFLGIGEGVFTLTKSKSPLITFIEPVNTLKGLVISFFTKASPLAHCAPIYFFNRFALVFTFSWQLFGQMMHTNSLFIIIRPTSFLIFLHLLTLLKIILPWASLPDWPGERVSF